MLDFLKSKLTGPVNIKALTDSNMMHPVKNPLFFLTLPRTKIDYKKDIGTGIGSSSVMAPVQWIQRAFPEAPLKISKITNDGKETVEGHPLIEIINKPNPFYSGISLWWASIFSWITTGNVYWLIERNSLNKPLRLWHTAPWLIKIKFPEDGSEFLTGYEYTPRGEKKPLDIEDVFHIKHGIDPDNPRLGISPIHACLREIWNDDESSNFVASLLRNSGVPGMVLSPDSDTAPEQGDVDTVKQYMKEMFSGDNRGEPLVMSGKTKVHEFGFDPQKLDLSSVRNTTEERVCANLGIPAAVVGFGSGLEQTKVGATMKELRELAWINGIMPIQRIFADEITRSLLPMFEENPEQFVVEFDLSGVAALDDDMDKKYERSKVGVLGGFVEVAEARAMVGLDVREGDRIFLRPANSFETPTPQKAIKTNGKVVKMEIAKPKEETTPTEQRVIDDAPRRRPSRDQVNLIRRLEELERSQAEPFAKELTRVFDDLGKIVSEVAEERLKTFANAETKDPESDSELIASLVDFGPVREVMRAAYSALFDKVVRSTFEESNTALGLSVNLPDPIAIRVAETGGRRLGLIDLRKQTRDRLFTTIAEAREQGLGVPAIARRIREDIPKGPWSSVQVRSRIIARTETKFAQNQSMIEYSKASGAQHAMVFDARLGATDAECEALDGTIVTMAEAEQLMESEHPNGTRSFTPWYEEVGEATG